MTGPGRQRRRWKRWALLVLLLVVAFVPVERYRPSCGGWESRHFFGGPMRDVYVGMITEAMAKDGIPHIRIGNEVFTNLIYPTLLLNYGAEWQSHTEFAMNTEWRIVSNIAHGYGPNETRVTPPPVLVELLAEARAQIENDPSLDEREKWDAQQLIFDNDCELTRAAAIRIEDMATEDLARYVPKSPLPPGCAPLDMRGWRRACGLVTGEWW